MIYFMTIFVDIWKTCALTKGISLSKAIIWPILRDNWKTMRL